MLTYARNMKIVFLVFLIAIVEGCPSGWLQHGDMCYYFSRGKAKSWSEASGYCQAFRFQLAEPKDPSALNFIKSILTKNSIGQRYYIGGSDIFVEGEWIWSSDLQPVTQLDWEPNEPNNVGSGEDCMTINPDGRWNDVPCDVELPFICEAENTNSIGIVG